MVKKMGFAPNFVWSDNPAQAPNYGGVQKNGVHIHFIIVDNKMVCDWTVCRIFVTDIESHYKNAVKHGIVHPNSTLSIQPWGAREFSILDAFGVCIHIAEKTAV